jgi:hypothetical protein
MECATKQGEASASPKTPQPPILIPHPPTAYIGGLATPHSIAVDGADPPLLPPPTLH